MNDVRNFGYCCKDAMRTFCWFASKKSPPFVRTGNVIRWTSLTQRSLAHILLIEKTPAPLDIYKISCYLQGYSFTSQVVRRISEPSIDFFSYHPFLLPNFHQTTWHALGPSRCSGKRSILMEVSSTSSMGIGVPCLQPVGKFADQKMLRKYCGTLPWVFLFLNTNNPKTKRKRDKPPGKSIYRTWLIKSIKRAFP